MNIIVFLEPGYEGDKFYKSDLNDWHRSAVELKRQAENNGHEIHVWPNHAGKPDVALYFGIPKYSTPPVDKSVGIFLEPHVVHPRYYEKFHALTYTRKLTFYRPLVDNKTTFYSPFPYVPYEGDMPTQRTLNCVAVSSYIVNGHPDALYQAREQAYLSMGLDLDLYGRRWHNWPELAKVNYQGEIRGHKVPVMAQYRQAIVFENCVVEGLAQSPGSVFACSRIRLRTRR